MPQSPLLSSHRSRAAGLIALVLPLTACQTTQETPRVLDGFSMPPLPISSPREMMGKDDGALRATLGNPALLRSEDIAQVWQYRGASCVLDFFLYQEGEHYMVTHIESRSQAGGAARPDLCLHDVHRTRYLSKSAGV
jgi:hypothetical protein